MCKALYIASDEPLPLIPSDERQPNFCVINLIEQDQKVIRNFSKPHVYCVATKMGCACDFQYGQYAQYGLSDLADEQEEAEGRETVHRLSEYLSQETKRVGELEMFTCWEDNQDKAPTYRVMLHPSDFGGKAFTLTAGQFATVLPDAAE